MKFSRFYLYNPTELICQSHNVKFIEFYVDYKMDRHYKMNSYGCPVCVGLIRAKVQMEIARGTKIGSHGKRIRTTIKRNRMRRINLTIVERNCIIQAINNGEKRNVVASRHNINSSTIDRIRRSEREKNAKIKFAKGIAATGVAIKAA